MKITKWNEKVGVRVRRREGAEGKEEEEEFYL